MILSLVSSTTIPAHTLQNEQDLYESGRTCQTHLLGSPKKKRYRSHWERCIQPLERLRSSYPQSPVADHALFLLGSLYRGLHGYSGRSEDLEKAILAYEKLLDEYPKSSLARKARPRLDALNPTHHD